MARMTRTPVVLAATALALAGISSSVATGAAARSDSGTAWLGVTHSEGKILVVAGDFKDKILGKGAVVYRITASAATPGTYDITSKDITLYTKKGSLSGTGSATETIDSAGNSTVSNGHIKLNKGTGKLKGHSLVATFSGPLQNGVYTFTYQGTYK
jgi:ABC-type Zn uptake system ZnuABC Zn-binding protein ZnuA